MIMSMFNVIAVTNRTLCEGEFLTQIQKIAKAKPYRIILREKDMPESDYLTLAKQVLEICMEEGAICTLHTFDTVAKDLCCPRIHLPFYILEEKQNHLESFSEIGASVHSVEEAKLAQAAGATYVTAGHIFTTDCKPGVPSRGVSFLQEVKSAVSIPVFAIGGITLQNLANVKQANVAGACIMSGFMLTENPEEFLFDL